MINPKEIIEYICEIAYGFGYRSAQGFYSKDLYEKYMNAGLDYEDMVKFYTMILKEAEKVEQGPMYCGLLQEIYDILDDAKAIERIHNAFIVGQ